MKKFEYMRKDNCSIETLNKLGQLGWMLCGVESNGGSTNMWFVREITGR